MQVIKIPCSNCGVLILKETARRTGGLCKTCHWKKTQKELELQKLAEPSKPDEWKVIYSSIGSMRREEILKLRCPSCNGDLQICYGEVDTPLKNFLSIRCVSCFSGVEMDGLAEKPDFLKEMPYHFRINSNGTFDEIITPPESIQKFKVGNKIIINSNFHNYQNVEGIVREVVWNFTKNCWDYLVLVDGNPVHKRFKEEELTLFL